MLFTIKVNIGIKKGVNGSGKTDIKKLIIKRLSSKLIIFTKF